MSQRKTRLSAYGACKLKKDTVAEAEAGFRMGNEKETTVSIMNTHETTVVLRIEKYSFFRQLQSEAPARMFSVRINLQKKRCLRIKEQRKISYCGKWNCVQI